ncbi:AraC family transcriptional regulator [Trinickia fusca]|uniref:AraC family transcriptional regulator n=1 Tax=Trinickia fusca TaxID=2419777 RepID=A0A494XJZ7_9BURK|nr:AraC family transcriptional regulator [Trinickia fusca]RKP48459.1 AraC family transcriptional regulator [Trinickia fusca]
MTKANNGTLLVEAATAPRFWRDETLPFVEARSVQDGRKVSYGKHTHDTFSIGAITGGRSTYLNGQSSEQVGAGTVVVMNPEETHACNPIGDQPWAYRMLYVDAAWLTDLQHDLGFSQNLGYRGFSTRAVNEPALHTDLNKLYTVLTDPNEDHLRKHSAAVTFFSEAHRTLNPVPKPAREANQKVVRAAEYIRENCTQALRLEDICAAAELSASHLIRAFKEHYGMTPHAYLINRRIEYSRSQLKRGRAIADVAIEAGFSDQAHLQRAFRQLVAATPGQYRSGI